MAYTPIGRLRPPAVTAAVYLLYLIAVAQLLSGGLGLLLLNDVREAYEVAYGGAEGSGPAKTAVVVGASMRVLLAAGHSLLAYPNGRGSNGARITTWVILGFLGVLLRRGCVVPGGANRAAGNQYVPRQPDRDHAEHQRHDARIHGDDGAACGVEPARHHNPTQAYPNPPHPGHPYPAQPYPGQQYPGPQYPGPQYPGPQYPGPQYRQ
jgi:hypothetical protein